MRQFTKQDIRALKERRNLSQITMRELHEEAGLTLTRYAAIEGGHDAPTLAEWIAIDNAFYHIDANRALAAGKWVMSGTEWQSDARKKLARWNSAASQRAADGGAE